VVAVRPPLQDLQVEVDFCRGEDLHLYLLERNAR
jgi:hypothetical protein